MAATSRSKSWTVRSSVLGVVAGTPSEARCQSFFLTTSAHGMKSASGCAAFLAAWSTPPLQAIRDFLLDGPRPVPRIAPDEGAHYKIAEMAVTKRSLPEGFWGPALVAPFHPQRPQFSLDLLARFTTTLQHLDCGVNAMVLDICAGYAWTTELLVPLGYRAIAVDICRDYILAGLPRMGAFLPHLLVADVENLPLVR